MYNRYVPQNDGSYRRRSIPDHSPFPPHGNPESWNPEQEPSPAVSEPSQTPPKYVPRQQGAFDFLRNLLPRGLDTEDLLILILLLLMSGEDQEGKNFPLLTLALYLFL